MIATVLAAAMALQSAQQFDLACTGSSFSRLQGGRGEAFNVTLRIDLAANRWCDGDCSAPMAIVSATPDAIVLEDVQPAPRGLNIRRKTEINRVTGVYDSYFSAIGSTVQQGRQEARCEVKPFSGMPQARF